MLEEVPYGTVVYLDKKIIYTYKLSLDVILWYLCMSIVLPSLHLIAI